MMDVPAFEGEFQYNKTINTDKPMKKIRITDKDGIVNEFDACDVTVEEIDIPDGFKPIRVPDKGEVYFDLDCKYTNMGFGYAGREAPTGHNGPKILDEEHSKNYAEAMNVLFELWACDGVVDSEEAEWDSTYQAYADLEVFLTHSTTIRNSYLMPPFESNEAIYAAIQKVGPERIKKMFRSFKFIK